MQSEIRYNMVPIPLTQWERIVLWWRNLRYAFTEAPPTTRMSYVEVKEGEFGYENAAWRSTIIQGPRFEFKNGGYVRVEDAET